MHTASLPIASGVTIATGLTTSKTRHEHSVHLIKSTLRVESVTICDNILLGGHTVYRPSHHAPVFYFSSTEERRNNIRLTFLELAKDFFALKR